MVELLEIAALAEAEFMKLERARPPTPLEVVEEFTTI